MNLNVIGKTEQSDELLCAQAAMGDREAEEVLVVRYQRLTRACTRPYFLAGGDSEDLIQEAMFGLLKAIREFDPQRDTQFRTFAETCIRNRIRSAVTTASRDKHAPLNQSVPFEHSMLGNDSSPEELFINKEEEQERLAEINRHLSPLERRILSLYLSGFSYQNIGLQLNKPVKSIDNAVQRIRRKAAAQYGVFSKS